VLAKKFTQINVIGLNVERLAGRKAMEKVMEGREELKSSVEDEELAIWVNGAVQRMDALLPEETRNSVMETCGRNCSEVNRRAIDASLEAEESKDGGGVHRRRGQGGEGKQQAGAGRRRPLPGLHAAGLRDEEALLLHPHTGAPRGRDDVTDLLQMRGIFHADLLAKRPRASGRG
jgi:hypothetical protein